MPRGPAKKKTEDTTSQSLESKLWATADKLRGHLDAADYKHVVLGLIFLKYISDRFAQRHAEITAEVRGVSLYGIDWISHRHVKKGMQGHWST